MPLPDGYGAQLPLDQGQNRPQTGSGPQRYFSQQDADTNYWSNYFQNQGLAPMPGYDTTAADAARQQQMQVMQQLQGLAAGDRNSQAQQELRASYGQAGQAQSALASSQRGVNAGAQAQQAQEGQGQVQTGLAGQQALLQQQQQLAAQQMLAQQLGLMQNQDLSQAQTGAGASLQAQALQQAMQQFMAGQGAQYSMGQTDIQNQLNNANFNQGVINNGYIGQAGNMAMGAAGGALGTLMQLPGAPSPAATMPQLPYGYVSGGASEGGGSSPGEWASWPGGGP